MNIKCVCVGYLQENCYILTIHNKSLIIDPGDEYDKIIKELGNTLVEAILITHRHFDHIGALDKFKNIPIYEYKNLLEKNYKIGDFSFQAIYTKGHTSDSVTYYFEKQNCMFVGDFIFKNTIGRTDLETGNMEEMLKSIKKIKKYPKDTILFPGHGECTTLKDEINNNKFFFIDI